MKRYYYQDDQSQVQGPFPESYLASLYVNFTITSATLVCEEGSDDWRLFSDSNIFIKNDDNPLQQDDLNKLPQTSVKESGVAILLIFVAVIELIAAPIAGLTVGDKNATIGWILFFSGLISGLMLLGFARIIEYTYESAQRLQHLELLLRRNHNPNA